MWWWLFWGRLGWRVLRWLVQARQRVVAGGRPAEERREPSVGWPEDAATAKGRQGEEAVEAVIAAAGMESLCDVILPAADGGGLVEVDHLVKLPVGIAVIETKNHAGRFYGRTKEKWWTKWVGGRKYVFQSPLAQNYAHELAVRAIVPADVAVFGQVIFVGNGKFPKGMPENVSGVEALRDHLMMVKGMTIPIQVEEAWEALRAVARRDDVARQRHREQVERKKESSGAGRPVAFG